MARQHRTRTPGLAQNRPKKKPKVLAASRTKDQDRLNEVAREILRAFRYGRDLSLLTIEVSVPKGSSERIAFKGADSLSGFFDPHLRNTDSSLSMGPDQLLLLLPETPEEGAAILGRRLIEIYVNTPGPSSPDPLPATQFVRLHAGVSSIGIGGHTDSELVLTSQMTARAAMMFSEPLVSLKSLLTQQFSIFQWIGLYATLSDTEILVLSRVFERALKEPFGFMNKLSSQIERFAEELELDSEDREALTFWIYAMELPRFSSKEKHQVSTDPPEYTSRRKKLLFQRGLELFGIGAEEGGRGHKSRWNSPVGPALFQAAIRIRAFFDKNQEVSTDQFDNFIRDFPDRNAPASVIRLLSKTSPMDWVPFREEMRF
ncbi:MAG: hypothetical protein ACYCTV_06515 [Leptospirales bacterium]